MAALLLGMSLGAAARAEGAPAPCAPLGTAPLADVAGFIVASVGVDGDAVSLVVDTGSDAGLLDRAALPGLGLLVAPHRSATLGAGSDAAQALPVAIVRRLAIGALLLGAVPFPVGTLPQSPNIAPPVVGLLGGDVLHHFAVELDLARGRLALWRDAPGCGGLPPWADRADVLPLGGNGATRTVAAVLDGTPVTALLDSGARSRIVAPAAAARVGVSRAALAAEPGGLAARVGGPETEYHWHRFRSLRVGAEITDRPVLTVAPIGDGPDMLLGADWFARHHLWISYATNRLYVARGESEP